MIPAALRRMLIALSLCAVLAQVTLPLAQAAGPAGPTDAQEREAFFDGLLAGQMQARHLPGATVAVVKDGSPLLVKGYGYADLESRRPVVGDRTLFHAGSVSKLLTWTAAMQLVEQGQLDLNADVNAYLQGLQIPATFPTPVTMAHLMNHAAGFEDQALEMFAARADDLLPLRDYLATHIPARVRAPGELAAYSNFGTSLAGLIVEQVSGLPFERYVEERIFEPLGMARSSFRQPLPAELAGDLANGYTYAAGAQRPCAPEWIQSIPAGALSTTAADMAAFMIAHLEGGSGGQGRILREDSLQQMHEQSLAHDPRVSGLAHGFLELNLNGQRLLTHGGDSLLHHSLLALLPEQRVGFFVSFNSMGEGAGAALARYEILQAFLDRYYPAPELPALQPPADFAARAGRITGHYVAARSNHTTIEKTLRLLQQAAVSAGPEGVLTVRGPAPQPSHWAEVEPLVFRNLDNQDLLVFRADSHGRVTHLFYGNDPTTAYIKLPWYLGQPLQFGLLGAMLLAFLSMLFLPLGLWLTRRGPAPGQPSPPLPRLARGVAWIVSALNIAFPPLMGGFAASLMKAPYGVPPALEALLAVPLVTAALAAGMVAFCLLAWSGRGRPWWGLAGRLHYTLVTVAAVAFAGWLCSWNLLGFRF